MSRRRKKKLPKEPVQAKIESLSHDGRGIASIDGKTTFIDYALPNEEVSFIYTNKRGRYDEGRTIEVCNPSQHRIQPKCQHFGICGGCRLQHLEPTEQIKLKQQTLLEQLQHFGNIHPEEILPPITGPLWNYRHKARLGVRYVAKKERVLVGFREVNGSYVADISRCEILHPSVATLFEPLENLILKLNIYHDIPQIEVAIGDNLTALVIRHLKTFNQDDEEKLRQFAQTHKLRIYLQPDGLNTTHLFADGCSTTSDHHEDFLSYYLSEQDLKLYFHPQDFSQVNAEINRKMIRTALELLQPQSDDTMLDLFCGFGNFTLPFARQCATIIGIEGNQIAVDRANHNREVNHIGNAEFHCADLNKDFTNEPWAQQTYDNIVIDPPRSGAWDIIQHIDRFDAKHILYISCNPATLARDAGELVHKHNYQLMKAGVMDMFPHTAHVESIALFTRR